MSAATWLSVGLAQAVGQRSGQQDCVAHVALPPTHERGSERVLVVVADGMGGHAAGDVASKTAINAFMAAAQDNSKRLAVELLRSGLTAAARAIQDACEREPELRDMGTTFLAGVVDKDEVGPVVQWISVGDSPFWRVDAAGVLERLNEDQSLAGELEADVKAGRLTPEQASSDSRRGKSNILTNALMAGPFDLGRADLRSEPLRLAADDMLLFASDGAETLSEKKIGQILKRNRAKGAKHAADELVKVTLAQGAKHQDNITVALVALTSAIPKRRFGFANGDR